MTCREIAIPAIETISDEFDDSALFDSTMVQLRQDGKTSAFANDFEFTGNFGGQVVDSSAENQPAEVYTN